jgi:hypothetical protein
VRDGEIARAWFDHRALFFSHRLLHFFGCTLFSLQSYDSGVEESDLDNPHSGGGGHSHGGMSPEMMNMFMRQHMGGGGGGGFGF